MDFKAEKNNLLHFYLGYLTSRVATLNSYINNSSYNIETQKITRELKDTALAGGNSISVVNSILLTNNKL